MYIAHRVYPRNVSLAKAGHPGGLQSLAVPSPVPRWPLYLAPELKHRDTGVLNKEVHSQPEDDSEWDHSWHVPFVSIKSHLPTF